MQYPKVVVDDSCLLVNDDSDGSLGASYCFCISKIVIVMKLSFHYQSHVRNFSQRLQHGNTFFDQLRDIVDVNLKSSNVAATQSQPESRGCAC